MAPAKRVDLEKLSWSWVETVSPEQIEKIHLESAYRIGLRNCKNCKRNCTNNPRCLTGLGEEKYMKSQPAEEASLESSLSELRDPTQYVGLQNLGATCYVNSLIQVWFHNEDMRRIIYKWNAVEDPEEREHIIVAKKSGQEYFPSTVVGQLQYLFAMMQFGNRSLLDPTNLAIALSLDTTTQQDAQEFSKLLLCHIEGKLQQDEELKGMLQRLGQGKYSYVNCCTTCGTEYSTSTTFYELDLQLAATLREAIEKYLTEEKLTGANQYLCATCNEKKDARRFIRLDFLPETLNIQLLRFVFHRDSGQKKKLNSFIQFPEDLDMSEYLSCPPQTHLYSLVAVLSHKGPSAHSGHYIANICSTNGEWYQFSDDKVEKMQTKRIEDGPNDIPKSVKRGRVPKGFLSSNTAYMLVYKKLTNDSKTNNGKKGKLKKIDTETCGESSSPHETRTQDGSGKKMDDSETRIKWEGLDSEKPKHLEDEKMDSKEIEHAEYPETPADKSSPTPEIARSIEEIIGLPPPLIENEAVEKKVGDQAKKVRLKDSQPDYKKLNGAAHRAMSCGERDFYEEVEFDRWEVSEPVRKLVRDENIKHELSLLALQEEKLNEIKEQNDKRQLVIDFYNLASAPCTDEYQWIPSEWLSKWLNSQSASDQVAPIDNSTLLCPHHLLDPLKVNRAKCVPTQAANLLYNKYRGGPRLDQDSLCKACVKQRCKLLRFKMALERDHKEVSELMRNFKEPDPTGYAVGSESLKSWRRLAMEKFLEDMEQERNRDDRGKERKISEKGDDDSPKEVEENEENEALVNFNEDLLCEHNSLKTPNTSRKIVPPEAWNVIKKYFPSAKAYSMDAPSCFECEERLQLAQKVKEDAKSKAKQQKEELSDLYYGKNKNEILKCNDPKRLFYIVEKGFLDAWHSFVRYAETFSRTPPPGVRNAQLLCELHKGFLYQPSATSELYSIATAEEWTNLTRFYEVDYVITIRKAGSEFITDPGSCAACVLARVEQERLESLKYERATIYIKSVDDSEDYGLENGNEVSAKRPKMDSARPSRTRRKLKGSHELKVSSDITLKELKVMTMQICGAGPYDQHLMLGEHELMDHSQSLASLGIFPGALLTLKIDTPIESEADVESDATNPDAASPEKGFKGTELVLS